MTAASPVPVHPRLGVRVAYRLQQVLRPNAGYRRLSEVYPEQRCVWVDAYDRAASQGRVGDLRLLHRPIDYRRGARARG